MKVRDLKRQLKDVDDDTEVVGIDDETGNKYAVDAVFKWGGRDDCRKGHLVIQADGEFHD